MVYVFPKSKSWINNNIMNFFILNETNEILYSMDYSSSVDANFKNNYLKRSRLKLIQASIYEMPFRKNTFDKIFNYSKI